MAERVTVKHLYQAIEGANEMLAYYQAPMRLVYGGRYGYQAVDYERPRLENGRYQFHGPADHATAEWRFCGTHTTGTSRECIAWINTYLAGIGLAHGAQRVTP